MARRGGRSKETMEAEVLKVLGDLGGTHHGAHTIEAAVAGRMRGASVGDVGRAIKSLERQGRVRVPDGTEHTTAFPTGQ